MQIVLAVCLSLACQAKVAKPKKPAKKLKAPSVTVTDSRKADKFTGETAVQQSYLFTDSLAIDFKYTIKADGSRTPIVVEGYRVQSQGRFGMASLAWTDQSPMNILADGDRIEAKNPKYEGNSNRGGVSETIAFTVPMDKLRTMAAAKSLEIRINLIVFDFQGKHSALAKFLDGHTKSTR